mgnify:FL=1|jgi:hypothetical protein|tara:strand:- start:383 stop:679 length:297 start_codon:yes stop_codon:yes gene_type:complete
MEWLITTIGAKTCCILSAGVGGATNCLTQKKFNLYALKDVGLALIVGWIAAEFFIPPVMKHWALDMIWGPAIAFLIGYMGIRLLPMAEEIITKRLGGK